MTLGKQPGAAFPLLPIQQEIIIANLGNIEASDGARVALIGDVVFFSAALASGERIEFGIPIFDIFGAIQQQHKTTGS